MTEHNLTPIGLTTEQFAQIAGVKATSVRVRLCNTGSYFGIVPQKMPNNRLFWPHDSLERLCRASSNSSAEKA